MSGTQQLLLSEGGGGGTPNYIEDVFSTYLYTGTGASQTIVNGIDLSTKGGLAWVKQRDFANGHILVDTVRGGGNYLQTNTTGANEPNATVIPTFTTTGFNTGGAIDSPAKTYASWTFRKQPKFFDVVTYTGTGSARTVAHSLGSTPGCIIVKKTSNTDAWLVYHRSNGATGYTLLNTTAAFASNSTVWNNTDPTSTDFTVGTSYSTNQPSETYVAYIFAHDAGGFGLTGTDNVISCGSATAAGVTTVTLGYEPQWVLIKRSSGTGNWFLIDNMRGFNSSTYSRTLYPNLTNTETELSSDACNLTSTGFVFNSDRLSDNGTYIYIVIRRGPMKVPTDGTKVFSSNIWTATPGTAVTTGFPVDMMIDARRDGNSHRNVSRLMGVQTYSDSAEMRYPSLVTTSTGAQQTSANFSNGWGSTGYLEPSYGNTSANVNIGYSFKRAPSFFDVVCYTGNATTRTISHNLGVAPELIITKTRSTAENWGVYHSLFGSSGDYLFLNRTNAKDNDSALFTTTPPTSSVFSVGTAVYTNENTATMVAYLFATCAGVSKVGSYTGTGTTKQVDCGFAAGARFVLIKRTDSTGDWYVWDTVRGIVSGNDPYLLINSDAVAEVTNTDYIDPYSAGFELSSTAPAAINASGGTFIFLAIA